MEFSISEPEHKRRIEQFRKYLRKRKLEALHLANGTSMFYLTGYSFIATERPAASVIPVDDKITFNGPLLEEAYIPLKTRTIKDVKKHIIRKGDVVVTGAGADVEDTVVNWNEQ